jgi:hypothetical protein
MNRSRLIIVVLGVVAVFGGLAWMLYEHFRAPKFVKLQVAEPTVLSVLKDRFHCTIYYTPLETGFHEEEGFNVKPETRAGLDGHEFPRDFLLAVEKEGFGKMRAPIKSKNYVQYYGGEWGFAELPIDGQKNPLVPKKSWAVSKKQRLIPAAALLRIEVPDVEFAMHHWLATDTGSGLDENQIDLYWGEDDPLGPGERLSRPKTAPFPPRQLATVSILK